MKLTKDVMIAKLEGPLQLDAVQIKEFARLCEKGWNERLVREAFLLTDGRGSNPENFLYQPSLYLDDDAEQFLDDCLAPDIAELRKVIAKLAEAGFSVSVLQYIDDAHQNHAWYNGHVADVFFGKYVCEISTGGRVAVSVLESERVIAKTDTVRVGDEKSTVLSDLGLYIPNDIAMCSVMCGEKPDDTPGRNFVMYECNQFEWRLFDRENRREFRHSDDTMHEFDTIRICDCLEPELLEDLVFGLVKEI